MYITKHMNNYLPMAEDNELVLPAGLDDMGVDPLDKLRLSPPVPLPSDIIPLSMILYHTVNDSLSYY